MTEAVDKPVDLPATGYVRQKQLLAVVPFSAATLWRKVKSGQFPPPVKLSEGITGWSWKTYAAGWIVRKSSPVRTNWPAASVAQARPHRCTQDQA